jgi:hypothetical protein
MTLDIIYGSAGASDHLLQPIIDYQQSHVSHVPVRDLLGRP